jgi:hypothetical protein
VIVVAGSRHDPVAVDLVNRWSGAALCSAEDLVQPGWIWSSEAGGPPSTWVVDGRIVPDDQVTGVFVRRTTVYPGELAGTQPEDRSYLASELHAFLAHVLQATGAVVVNPVDDGATFGEASLRPEHWMAVAAGEGVAVAPLRVRSDRRPRPAEATHLVEVVDGEALGEAPTALAGASVAVCTALDLRWAVTGFDRRERLTALTTNRAPSAEAVTRLLSVLAREHDAA